jgi:uncharacterized alpha-E superfamily protein
MLARHAESLFWMGRYMERAEDTSRMLDVTYHGLLESPPEEATRAWLDLLSVLNLEHTFGERHHEVTAGLVSEFLVLDEKNSGAIVGAIAHARENARSVRELISTELWEAVNTFWLELLARNLRADIEEQPYELYGLVRRRCQMVNGVASETMSRDDGWRFLMLGWMLERAEMSCRLLNVRYGELSGATDLAGFHLLVGVLKSASASEAYRKTYGAAMDPARVVEFLLLSRTFPRSVLYCLRQAERDLARLTAGDALTRPERIVGRIRAELEFCDVAELLEGGLHGHLDRIQDGVREASDAIAGQYFRNVHIDLHSIHGRPFGERG